MVYRCKHQDYSRSFGVRQQPPFGAWKRQRAADASGGPPLSYAKLIDDYLNEAHRDPGTGCAVSALAAEIARSDKRTRALACEEIRNNLQLIAGLLPGKDERAARSKAILTYSAQLDAVRFRQLSQRFSETVHAGLVIVKLL